MRAQFFELTLLAEDSQQQTIMPKNGESSLSLGDSDLTKTG